MAISESTVRSATKKVFILALLIAVFSAAVIDVVIPITILDISETFRVLPGTVAQLDSIIAVATVMTALFLAGFGDRFRYKSQVMIGLLFIAFCSIGLYLAPTFPIVQLVVPLNGIGSVLIVVSAQTFIGNSYPLDKKAKAIGWIAAAGTLANALGSPIIGFITGFGGWRSVFIWFMLPAVIVSLIFMFLVFPKNLTEPQSNTKKESFIRGFKQILTNKSAMACLITAFFITAYSFGALVFEVTFLRQIFNATPGFAALIGPMAGAGIITLGAIIGGHVINRVGRKRLTVFAILLAGSLLALSYFMQDLSLFITLHWLASIFIGITITASSNLVLEQVPNLRGTAMSLNSALSSVGTAFGIALTGAVLNIFINPTVGFQALGLTVGILAFSGALVNLFFAREPIRIRVSSGNT
jgi:predicted MFS family arabinose efflux permease